MNVKVQCICSVPGSQKCVHPEFVVSLVSEVFDKLATIQKQLNIIIY